MGLPHSYSEKLMSRNCLGPETSPYLLQHKDNPVHWRPWGSLALDEARAASKPILLSIGYAACHWCHVMAHESFEDPAVAAVMNRLFVNIKVDREERPDIDAIYMQALHLLGVQGGWPLTMFLTPEGAPFWGGTYFPKEPRYGRPGFIQVLDEIARLYAKEADKVEANATALRQALAQQSAASASSPGILTPDIFENAADRFFQLMDPTQGGLRGAPKFPQTALFELLWRHHLRTGDPKFADIVTRTLDHICEGGIYDHLGGGFARYSVDDRWLVPHFEKMLYDNAQLIALLTLVWQRTRKPLYARRIAETIDWLQREMIAPGGGFAASLDADSEGEEGRFYVWREAGIDKLLGPDSEFYKQIYDVTPGGNWPESPGGEGHTILNRLRHADQPLDEATETKLTALRAKLLAARAARIRPGWDDKVLSDWNGLMITALTEAATVFERPDWLAAARTAFDFICQHMIIKDRLMHSWRAGQARHRAMADDLANMTRAALALHEATAEATYLRQAQAWAAELDAHYSDKTQGGYFFTADDAEALIVRTRTINDNATPAANATLPATLMRLYLLTGTTSYRDRADTIMAAFAGELGRNLFPLATYLNSFDFLLAPAQLVIIGAPDDPATQSLRSTAFAVSLPNRLLTLLAPGADLPPGHPAHGKTQHNAKPTAYLCVGETCSLPVTGPADLIALLSTA